MRPLCCVLLAAVSICAATAAGADVKIIASAGVGASSVSIDELKAVFLGTRATLGDGSHVEPVLLKSGPAHEAFLKEYLGKSAAALETYYRSLVFSGKGSMPKMFASEEEVVAYVEKSKGAIGYVGAATASASAKVLAVK
jgi:ABC-type phosphate transport system substrate-binding protein